MAVDATVNPFALRSTFVARSSTAIEAFIAVSAVPISTANAEGHDGRRLGDRARWTPIMMSERSVALMLYAAFDESDDDTDQSEDEDSEDHDPRRSKRARHGVDELGASVK